MTDREKVIAELKSIQKSFDEGYGIALTHKSELVRDILELLKEQEEQVRQWTKEIADNQLAHAPDELDRENWDYKKGIWDGLQIAWNIISEGR